MYVHTILCLFAAVGIKRDRDGTSLGNMSAEFHISMAGLPAILRDLLAKLPLLGTHPSPDVDVRKTRKFHTEITHTAMT